MLCERQFYTLATSSLTSYLDSYLANRSSRRFFSGDIKLTHQSYSSTPWTTWPVYQQDQLIATERITAPGLNINIKCFQQLHRKLSLLNEKKRPNTKSLHEWLANKVLMHLRSLINGIRHAILPQPIDKHKSCSNQRGGVGPDLRRDSKLRQTQC